MTPFVDRIYLHDFSTEPFNFLSTFIKLVVNITWKHRK